MARQRKVPSSDYNMDHSGEAATDTSTLDWQNANSLQKKLKKYFDELCDASRKASRTPTPLEFEQALWHRKYRKFFQCFDERDYGSQNRERIKKKARTYYNECQMKGLYRTVEAYMDSLSKTDALFMLRELNERYVRDYTEYILCLSMYFLQAKQKIQLGATESTVADLLHDFPYYISGIILTVYLILKFPKSTSISSTNRKDQSQESIQLNQIKASDLLQLLKALDWRNLDVEIKEILRSTIRREADDLDLHAFFSYHEERHTLHFRRQAISDMQTSTNDEASLSEMVENEYAFQMQEGSIKLFGPDDEDSMNDSLQPLDACCPCSEQCRQDEIEPIIAVIEDHAEVDELGQTILGARHVARPLIQQISRCLSSGAYEQVLLLYMTLIKEIFPSEKMNESTKRLPAKLRLQLDMLLGTWEEDGVWERESLNQCQVEILLTCPNKEPQRSSFDRQWFGVWKLFCSSRDSTISSDNFVYGHLFTDHKPTRALKELRKKIEMTLGLDLKVFQRLWEQMLWQQYRKDTQWPTGPQDNNSETPKRALTETIDTEVRKRLRQEKKTTAKSMVRSRRMEVVIMTQEKTIVDQEKRLSEQSIRLEEQKKLLEERNKTIAEIVAHLKRRKGEGGVDTALEAAEQHIQNSPTPLADLFHLYHSILTEDLRMAKGSYKIQEDLSKTEGGTGSTQIIRSRETSLQLSGRQSSSKSVNRAAVMPTFQALHRPLDKAPQMDADPQQQLADLAQTCKIWLSIVQEDLSDRIKRIEARAGSTDVKLQNFLDHPKSVYGQIYKEEDAAFGPKGHEAHFKNLQQARIRVLDKTFQCVIAAFLSRHDSDTGQAAEGSSDNMFDTLQHLCALLDPHSQNGGSSAQIQTLKAEHDALMKDAYGEADADIQSHESGSADWKSLVSAISRLLEHMKHQASNISRLEREGSAFEWLNRLRDRLLSVTSEKESPPSLGALADYMNFVNEVTNYVEKLQEGLCRSQSQNGYLQGALQEIWGIFEDVWPHGSIEEYLDDNNRLVRVREALRALYAQELDPFHRYSTMWQDMLPDQDKASPLQQPLLNDLCASIATLQEGNLSTFLQSCQTIKDMTNALTESNKRCCKVVATLVQKYLGSLRALASERDELKTKSIQAEGAMVSLQQSFGNNWPYPDSQSLQRDPELRNLRSLVQGLRREQQPMTRKLLLDRDANDQTQVQQSELRSQISRELFSDLKNKLTTGLGNAPWFSSLGSCEDLDSVIHLICTACQSHDATSSGTLTISGPGSSGALAPEGSPRPSQVESKEPERQDSSLVSVYTTTPAHDQIHAQAPAQSSRPFNSLAAPGDLVVFNQGMEIELRSMLLEEIKSNMQATFRLGLIGQLSPGGGLNSILDIVKQSYEARSSEQAETIRGLEVKSEENLIAFNETNQGLQQMRLQIDKELATKALLQGQVRRLQVWVERLVAELQITCPTTIRDRARDAQSETLTRHLTEEEMAEEMAKLENQLKEARRKRRDERERERVHGLKMQLQICLGQDFFLEGCTKIEDCHDVNSLSDAVKQAKESHDIRRRQQEDMSRKQHGEIHHMRETMNQYRDEIIQLRDETYQLQKQVEQHKDKNEVLQGQIYQYREEHEQLQEETQRLHKDARRAEEALKNVKRDLEASELRGARRISQMEGLNLPNDAWKHDQTRLPRNPGTEHLGVSLRQSSEDSDIKRPLAYIKESSSIMGETERDAEIGRLKSRLSEVEHRLQSQGRSNRNMADALESVKRYEDYFARLQRQLIHTFRVHLPSILNPEALADPSFDELAQAIRQFCRAEDRDKIENLGRQLRSLDSQLNSQASLNQGLINRVRSMDFQRESLDRLQTKLTRAFGVVLPCNIAEQPISEKVLEELVASISESCDSRQTAKARHAEQEMQIMQQRLDRSQSTSCELQEQLGTARGQLNQVRSSNETLRDEVARLEMETSRRNLFERSMREYQQFRRLEQPQSRYAIKNTGSKSRQLDQERARRPGIAVAARHQADDDTSSESESELGSEIGSESCSQCQFDFVGPVREQRRKHVRTRHDARGGAGHPSPMADSSRATPRLSHGRRQATNPFSISYPIILEGQQYQIVRISKNSRSNIVSNVSIARKFGNGTTTEERSCSIPWLFCRGTVKEAIENSAALYRYCSSRSDGPHTTSLHPSIVFKSIEQKNRTANGCSFRVRYRDGTTAQVAASTLIRWGKHVAIQMGQEYLSKLSRH